MSRYKNMVKNLIDSALHFQMESNFKRIKAGKQLDINKRPYNADFINKMIKHFEDMEEYEKCNILLSFREKMTDHESNYLTSNK